MKCISLDKNNVVISLSVYSTVVTGYEFVGTFPVDMIPHKFKWIASETKTDMYIIKDGNIEYGSFEFNPEYIPFEIAHQKSVKISEMSEKCTQTIYEGTDIRLSDATYEHFTLDEHDQANLLGLGLELMTGAEKIAWHTDDKHESCKYYSAQDGQVIIANLRVFKEYHITYFRDLRIYINSFTTIGEINEIYYGYPLPEEYKSEVLKDLEKQLGM